MRTYAEAKALALAELARQIKGIRYESPDDEGAAEWQGHLASVKARLEKNEMTVEDAEDDLGIYLVDAEERRLEDRRSAGRSNFAAFGDESMR